MSTTLDGEALDTIRERFDAVDAAASRFTEVEDGGKACFNHDTRYDDPRAVPGHNYGIYSDESDAVVVLDVDDHRDLDSKVGLHALHALPPTLEAESPHGGTHKFYLVDLDGVDDGVGEFFKQRFGSANPVPSWGEVQAQNKYVVGAGSQLDGCGKDWCDECSTAEGGCYSIKNDHSIETVDADELADVLAADPQLDTMTANESATDHAGGGEGVDAGDDRDLDEWIDESKARELLSHIDPDIDYPQWNNIGLALGELFDDAKQREIFTDWSKDGDGWTDNDTDRLVDDIIDTTAHSVTPATIVEHAKAGGWQPSTRSNGHSDQPIDTVDDDASSGDLELRPDHVRFKAGLGADDTLADLNDRQKAAAVWSIIRQHDDVHVRCRRDNAALWAYDTDTGTWNDDGERTLRHAAVKALTRQQYGANVLAELKAQVRADFQVELEADEFGVDTGTVAVANGLLDLDAAAAGDGSDAIRELRPDDYALSRLPVEFDPTAEHDEWSGYVDEWVESGYADALQEFVGYCLHIGSMPIHRALLLVGSGSNGKGTFLHVVRSLLGSDNTSSTELQTLANERDAVADMQGSLANIDDDLSSRGLGSGLGMFKKLVAGDPVRGRRLYEDGFEFEPSTKHLYAANQVPDVQVSDEDEAFWRRWLLVEFPNHYAPAERDSSLRDRLTTDDVLSGVLNWAIEGRRRLLDQGYFTGELELAYDKRRRWQQWGDTVDEFIEDCVEHDSDAERITTGDAYQVYQEWCRRSGDDPVGQRRFTDSVKTEGVGFGKHRIDGTVTNGYTALGFTDKAPDLDAALGSDDDDESSDSQNQAINEFDGDDDDDGGDQAGDSGDDGAEVGDPGGDDGDAEGGTEADESGEEQADNDDDDGGNWASALGVITTKVDDGAEIEPTDLADRTGKPELYWSNALDALADQSDAVERDGGGGYHRAG